MWRGLACACGARPSAAVAAALTGRDRGQGNDVFSCMLGKPMVYTCGIFHEMPKFASDDHKVGRPSPPVTARPALPPWVVSCGKAGQGSEAHGRPRAASRPGMARAWPAVAACWLALALALALSIAWPGRVESRLIESALAELTSAASRGSVAQGKHRGGGARLPLEMSLGSYVTSSMQVSKMVRERAAG